MVRLGQASEWQVCGCGLGLVKKKITIMIIINFSLSLSVYKHNTMLKKWLSYSSALLPLHTVADKHFRCSRASTCVSGRAWTAR